MNTTSKQSITCSTLLLCACAAPALHNPLHGAAQVELVRGGFQQAAGPTWRARDRVLLFSDVTADSIVRMDAAGEFSVWRHPSGRANGLAFDKKGRLIACEQGSRRVTRTLEDGVIEVLAASFGGKKLNSPHDLAMRADGTIYFTDPPFGIRAEQQEQPTNNVFKVAPDGKLAVVWAGALTERPNGITLSPDEQRLYVSDSFAGIVRMFRVAADGALREPTVFAKTAEAPDGMTVDAEGDLYVATAAGLQVFSPWGAPIAMILVPKQPSSCAFGGIDRRTLYITAQTALYRIRLDVPGLP